MKYRIFLEFLLTDDVVVLRRLPCGMCDMNAKLQGISVSIHVLSAGRLSELSLISPVDILR